MTDVLTVVKRCQDIIEKYPDDEERILDAIEELYELDVKIQHLQETGVGLTVNALRKEPGDVGAAAKALVYKWKIMVAAEVSDEEEESDTSLGILIERSRWHTESNEPKIIIFGGGGQVSSEMALVNQTLLCLQLTVSLHCGKGTDDATASELDATLSELCATPTSESDATDEC